METQLAASKEDIGASTPVIESEIGQLDTSETKLEGQEDPLNWSPLPRCNTSSIPSHDQNTNIQTGFYTITVVWISGIVGFSSSVQTPAITAIGKDFHTSRPITTLAASSVYLIGCAFGPLLFAPLSELW